MTDSTLTSRLRPWASRRLVCLPDHGDEVEETDEPIHPDDDTDGKA